MAVVTREDDQAVWEAIQALTVAQAQDRERVAKLEVQISESDKRLATKADVEKAISVVRSDVNSVLLEVSKLETKMFRLLLSIGVPLLLGMIATLYRLFM